MKSLWRWAAVIVVGLVAVAVLGCAQDSSKTAEPHKVQSASSGSPATVARTTTTQPGATASSRGAETALAALRVAGRAPKTGYARERFGDGWATVAGCDRRDRILTRDLTAKRYLDNCRVERGRLSDPYTAAPITFVRGGASEIDIDHVVALSDAWQKGAQRWTPLERETFANDPLNLLAVDASANRQKGDGDAATWLPANKRFRCRYVARQVAVKRRYRLSVTSAERDAIARVLAACPGQRLPSSGAAPQRVVATPSKPSSSGSKPSSSSGGHVYGNCDAARAAGAAPIVRGDPDYALNRRLDRDEDGVACE